MFKKIILLSVGILTSNALHGYPNKPLNTHTLPRYAEHYINTLFGTHRDQPREIREFIGRVKKSTLDNAQTECAEFFWFFPTGEFRRDCVEAAIRTTALNVIVEEVCAIVYGYTHDTATLNYIKVSIHHEVLKIFTESGNLNGSLRGYLGENLKQKVWQLKNKFDAEKQELAKLAERQQQSSEIKYYEAEECCICKYTFEEVRGIYLQPCGHKFCIDCTNGVRLCPLCRSEVTGRTL